MGFMYKLVDDVMSTYYISLDNQSHRVFHDERKNKYNRKFIQTSDFTNHIDNDIIYFTMIDTYDIIKPVYDEISKIDGLKTEIYEDVYNRGNWFFEIFSQNASKYNAVNYLRDNYSIEHIVAFGDNLNDIPMFKASDECYAVANARDELKEYATEIIDSNTDNGVVKQLAKLFIE